MRPTTLTLPAVWYASHPTRCSLDFHPDLAGFYFHRIGADRLVCGVAGGLAGGEVEIAAVQRTLDLAVLDTAQIQRVILVAAHLVDDVMGAAGIAQQQPLAVDEDALHLGGFELVGSGEGNVFAHHLTRATALPESSTARICAAASATLAALPTRCRTIEPASTSESKVAPMS